MIDVFTSKRISPECPLKSNQRPSKFSILTPWCAVWLHGVIHTGELDSAVGCTLRSLTPRYEAHSWNIPFKVLFIAFRTTATTNSWIALYYIVSKSNIKTCRKALLLLLKLWQMTLIFWDCLVPADTHCIPYKLEIFCIVKIAAVLRLCLH